MCYEYCFIEMGYDLYLVLLVLVNWGDCWFDEGCGVLVEYVYKVCGYKFWLIMVCLECGELVGLCDVMVVLGLGFVVMVGKFV